MTARIPKTASSALEHKHSPNRLSVVMAGLLLWAFVVVIPAIHTDAWKDFTRVHWWLACLPLGVLGALQLWNSRVAAVSGMPLAHLPILVTYPVLTGPKVYGPEAFAAVLFASVLWVWSCRPHLTNANSIRHNEPMAGTRPMPVESRIFKMHLALHVLLGVGLLGVLYFYEPFRLSTQVSYGESAPIARMVMALFLFLIWLLLLARQLAFRLANSLFSPGKQSAQLVGFALECANEERSRTNLRWSLVIASLSFGVLWILMHLEGVT